MTAITEHPRSASEEGQPLELVTNSVLEAVGLAFSKYRKELFADPDSGYEDMHWDVVRVDTLMGQDSMEHGMIVTVADLEGVMRMIQITFNVQHLGQTSEALLSAMDDFRY